jgi:predicted transcriptional regulator
MKTTKRDFPLVLNLSKDEMSALDRLAESKGQTKSAILRQALRLYESLDYRLSQGARIVLEEPEKKEKAEVILL